MDSAREEKAAPASTLAMALIISSQAPVVLLDSALDVVAASASFYRNFNIARSVSGRIGFAELGSGE